jgi:hypothetical protein
VTPPRDPDSGRGRAPRTPRARTDAGELDRTIDELTPVEHLISRVAAVESVVVDQAATIAERHEMPSTEAWHRLEDRIGKAEARVSVCETEREHRGKWTKIVRGVLASLGAAAVSALAWAVVKIGDAGEERADAKRRADDLRGAIEAVRALQLQMAADHALLIQHLSQPRQGP